MAVGRISGPLLKENLLRNGVNLAFETDLLYLDVVNNRVGIRNDNPLYELDVTGTTRTTNLEITTEATIADIYIQGNTISSTNPNGIINLGTADNIIYQNKLVIDSFDITGNTISTNESNADIEFRPNGTGSVEMYADTNVYGNIYASGNITLDGDITIGDTTTDTLTFNAEVASDIVPDQDNTYTLGTPSNRWADMWVNTFNVDEITTDDLFVDGIDLTAVPGNLYFVSENGSDTNQGQHFNNTFASVGHALSVASSGDTIFVYSGTYTETFPLTIPVGVTLKGQSLRSVTVQPTVGTQDQDAFLLNGESTIEDITVSGFYYNSIANTGHAFRFAPNLTVTSRSPYIRNISVITQGSTAGTDPTDPRGFDDGDAGRGAYIDGSVATANSREASMLFHSATFICPGVDVITMTNGVRVEWLNSFTYFADKGLYAVDGVTGIKGTGTTAIRLSGTTGTYSVGETVTYYDTDGTTVLAQGVIDSIDADGKIYLSGKVAGLITAEDRGGKTLTANGDAKLQTAQKKYGTASLFLDGTGDYVSVSAQDDFGFGTGDFTVEAFVYKTADTGQEAIIDFRTAATDNAISIGVRNSNKPYLYVNGVYEIDSATALNLSNWNHVAYVREGTTGTLYLNGTSVGTWTDNTDYGVAKPVIIGAGYTGGFTFWTGNIDEVRVLKGEAAYTGATIPVPTGEHVSNSNTVLNAHFNGTNASTTFEDDTLIEQDIRSDGGATSTFIDFVDYTDFGAEVRSIASACVYGNYGAYGDGEGVIMYLISQNFAYIGLGKEVDNDPLSVIQANEVVELNDAKIRYSSVDHKGDFRVGDLFYINQETGDVNFSTTNFNIESTAGLTLTNGVDVTTIDGTKIDTGNIRISGNTIETLSGDLNLTAASDTINLLNNVNIDGNLDVTGNVTIGGNITVGDEATDSIEIVAGINSDLIPRVDSEYNLGLPTNEWKNLYVNHAHIDDIEIKNNYIAVNASNADLELRAAGTGQIVLDDIKFKANVISSATDINIATDTEIVNINSTGSLNLPSGTTLERPGTAIPGMIRYNTDLSAFEGYDGNWITLSGGVYDLDRNTFITAELYPGANDNTIRFYVENSVIADINDARLSTIRVDVDDLRLDGNVLSVTTPDTSLVLTANGAGSVTFDHLAFKDNTITNIVPDSITTFRQSGDGYLKIEGTGGFVFPVGTSNNRPPLAQTERGMTRFNSEDGRLELFDGTSWVSVAGATGAISFVDAEFLAIETVLTLG